MMLAAPMVEAAGVDFGGNARVRGQFKDKPGKTAVGTVANRFSVDASFSPTKEFGFFLQPQFSHTWGQGDDTGARVSGTDNDPDLSVHQAYMKTDFSDDFSLTAGRQELSYGDQYIMGRRSWSNVGQSFDAFKLGVNYGMGWFDVFWSKLNVFTDSRDFMGLYNSFDFGEALRAVDLYALYLADYEGATDLLWTFGLRLASNVGALDYRVEGNYQMERKRKEDTAHSFDLGFGYTFLEDMKTRFGIGYARASNKYNSLFGARHRFLGQGDFFARQNIQDFRAELSSKVVGSLKAGFEYHYFMLAKRNSPLYDLDGNSYGSKSDATQVGHEFDLWLKWMDLVDGVDLGIGTDWFLAGKYMKDNGKTRGYKTYLQLSASL
jgi:hypothetical protein